MLTRAISAGKLPQSDIDKLKDALAAAGFPVAPKADESEARTPEFTGGTTGCPDSETMSARKADALFSKFHHLGPGAVDAAAGFAREHAELVRRRQTSLSEDRYVELSMKDYQR